MKKFIFIGVSLVIILTLGILEIKWIDETFFELEERTSEIIKLCEDKVATREEVATVCDWWQDKKRSVHIYIPHDAIADIDYWLNEAQGHVANSNYELALGKLYILIDASRTIPLTFKLRIENIL